MKKDIEIEARRVEAAGSFSYEVGKTVHLDRDEDGEPIWRRVTGLTIIDINPLRLRIAFEDGGTETVGTPSPQVWWRERNGEAA